MWWRPLLDEHMTRGEEIMRRSDEHMRRSDETMRLLRQDREDLRVFIREERIKSDRSFRAFEKRMEDMGVQIRADTAATWAMVDETKGLGA